MGCPTRLYRVSVFPASISSNFRLLPLGGPRNDQSKVSVAAEECMVSRMIKHFLQIRTSHIMLRLVTSRYLSGGSRLVTSRYLSGGREFESISC